MVEIIKLSLIETNKGQIEGLPKNPRFIKDEKFKKLVKSIEENPEMLELRELLVYPFNGKYVIIGGNMRYRAMKELGYKEAFCKIIPKMATIEQLKAYTIKDNNGYGEWDMDLLSNEWDFAELEDWGVDLPDMDLSESETESEKEDNSICEKDEKVELLLNKAMQQYCGEFAEQIDLMVDKGFIATGLSEGYAKIKFIKAKYYGKKYPRHCSLIFTPQQFYTPAGNHKHSYYGQLKESNKVGKAGIAGFRTVSEKNNDNLTTLLSNNYPIGCSSLCLDFPVEIARDLIRKYSNRGKVLDPCHGWGGRLVSAMLEDVKEYVGVDPSPYASKGVSRIYECFKEYSSIKKVQLLKMPFEDTKLQSNYFDMALTSPPYFDVEKYDGEDSSTNRYDNYKLWVEKFYKPLIEKTYDYLKEGGVFILQVGSQKYDLKSQAITIAEKIGFKISIIGKNILGSNNALHNTDEQDGETIILLEK